MSRKLDYRPEIDGLRAIAVLAVLFYHAKFVLFGASLFTGGFIGVDIFFVISGYLITRIILTELKETDSFKFLNFFERRARRILPMLFTVMIASLPVAWTLLFPGKLVEYAITVLSALFFSSNFVFYFSTTEYGASSALLEPMLHTWSLGVEEQFYIIMPLIMLLIWRFAKAYMLGILLLIALFSLQFAEAVTIHNKELSFYLPISRFWQLLAGGLLAKIEIKYGRFKHEIASKTLPIIGLFMILNAIFFFDETTRHPGFATLLPVIGTLLIIAFANKDDCAAKALSLKPVIAIGLISYSLYLWHFPIFAFARINELFVTDLQKIGWTALAFALSILSYFAIEKPFRNRNAFKTKPCLAVLFITFIALVGIHWYIIANKGFESRLPQILSQENVAEERWLAYKDDRGYTCHKKRKNFCTVTSSDEATHIYAVGDSHLAAISVELVETLKDDFNITTMNREICPLMLNTGYKNSISGVDHTCDIGMQTRRYERISAEPSIILYGGRFPLYLDKIPFDNGEGGVEELPFGEHVPPDGMSIEDAIRTTLETLIDQGHQIVLMYPIPPVGWNVPTKLHQELNGLDLEQTKDFLTKTPISTDYRFYEELSYSTVELFDSIDSPNIHRVYPHTLFCNTTLEGRCVAHDENHVFYSDDNHPTAVGAQMIVNLIKDAVAKAEDNIRTERDQ